MHLLLVEDDQKLSDYLSAALGREGYSVESCRSIDETNTYMASSLNENPSIVILDRMLGRTDGATMIPKIKEKYPDTRIVVLSSLDMPSEKARILDSGADEYIAKPFSLDELTARLRLVSRRSRENGAQVAATVRTLGNLSLDLRTQTASIGPSRLDLTRKEFQLLSLLLDSPGRVYNRFQILDRIWNIEHTTESNVVETAVKNLRKKLAEASCSAKIESKRNVGYWIEA